MKFLKQNLSTAMPVGPFILSTDGFTVDNNVTSTQIDCRIYKSGVLSSIALTTGAWSTAPANGMYLHTFTTANVDSIGNARFYYYTTARLPVWEDVFIESSNVSDFGSGTSAPGTPASVWANSSRDLSTYAGLSSAVWQETTRALTTGGVVWTVSSRDLSTYAGLSSAVWEYTSRLLTSAGTISSAVWAATTRTITSALAIWNTETTRTLTSALAIWNTETTRTLTSALVVWDTETTRLLTSGSAVWQSAARTLTSGAAMWSGAVDGTLTYDQAMKGLVAANLGNSTGGGTTAVSFQNFGTTVARLNYTVTTAGNRSLSTYSW
jgi:hypothetical protein